MVVTLGFLLALSVVIPSTNGPLEGQSVVPHTYQPETTNIAMIGTSSRSHRDHATSMQGIADAAEAVRFLPGNQRSMFLFVPSPVTNAILLDLHPGHGMHL